MSGTKIVVMALVDEVCAHLETTSIQTARDRLAQMAASQLPDELSGESASVKFNVCRSLELEKGMAVVVETVCSLNVKAQQLKLM